ncbi:MAG: UPF0158 family protein [Bacteroidota bacterium]
MKCFIRKEDKEVLTVMDWDSAFFDISCLPEEAQQELKGVQYNLLAYHEIEKMPSNKTFEVMENFADALPSAGDYRLKIRLIEALHRRRPFAQFKNVIDHSNYRAAWFEFREEAQREWVREQLEEMEIG